MTLKSIRKYFACYTAHEAYPLMSEMLLDIQDEVDSSYMKLPVDADGVPIRIGDELRSDPCKPADPCNTGGTVTSIAEGTVFLDRSCLPLRAEALHHVTKRTIEDVLRDVGVSVAAVSDVAAEIRDLMGVDR